jgi:hypothetical protein
MNGCLSTTANPPNGSLELPMLRFPCVKIVYGVAFLSLLPACLRGEDRLRLKEVFPVGYQYHVSCRVELAGSLLLPLEKKDPSARSLGVTGTSAIEYDERVLQLEGDAGVKKTSRLYRRIDFQRKVGDRLQESTIRPSVRRLVILRRKNIEVPFSPDGPLTWGEIDLVRTDVFTPALAALLPPGEVGAGSRWTAGREAILELTDMEKIDAGSVVCKLEQTTNVGKRRYARIGFGGTVSGANEDGPNRQTLEGYCFFDLESHHLSYLYLKGTNYLLDKDKKEQGKVVGHFTLTRQLRHSCKELSDEAWRGIGLEPDARNTLLLYDNPDLGIRFMHPRRWHVAGVKARQVALDEANGSGLLLTLEPPARIPTAAQLVGESKAFLKQQKVKIARTEAPTRLQASPAALDHFALETEQAGQRVLMDYFIASQQLGGVTVAGRLLPDDLNGLRKEVEGIARSIRITRTIVAEKK